MGAANTFDTPNQVSPQPLPVSVTGGKLKLKIPSKSVSAVRILLT